MHKSRLGGLIIDCQTDDLTSAGEFWSQALGLATVSSSHPDDEGYIPLEDGPGKVHVELQQVSHPNRVHIDIETDNVGAEVQRLERLGAKKVKDVSDWCIMEAPTGHRFCVIPAEDDALDLLDNVWE